MNEQTLYTLHGAVLVKRDTYYYDPMTNWMLHLPHTGTAPTPLVNNALVDMGASESTPTGSYYSRRISLVDNLRNLKKRYHNPEIVDRIVTLLELPPPDQSYWLSTTTMAADDPNQVSYPTKPEHCFDGQRRRRCSLHKFLARVISYGLLSPETDVQGLSQLWGRTATKVYSHTIVKGEDLRLAYRDIPGTGSCMAGDYHRDGAVYAHPGIYLYAGNPDTVALAVISRGTEQMGRALLWTLDDGRKYLDRIYPSDGGAHVDYLKTWATEQGILAHESGSQGATLSCTVKHIPDAYPYLDTFRNIKSYTDEQLVLTNGSGSDYQLTRVDNTSPFGVACSDCDRVRDEDDLITVANGDLVCGGCLADNYTQVDNDWYPDEDVSYCDYGSHSTISEIVNATNSDDKNTLVCEECLAESFTRIAREWIHKSLVYACEGCSESVLSLETAIDEEGYPVEVCQECLEAEYSWVEGEYQHDSQTAFCQNCETLGLKGDMLPTDKDGFVCIACS